MLERKWLPPLVQKLSFVQTEKTMRWNEYSHKFGLEKVKCKVMFTHIILMEKLSSHPTRAYASYPITLLCMRLYYSHILSPTRCPPFIHSEMILLRYLPELEEVSSLLLYLPISRTARRAQVRRNIACHVEEKVVLLILKGVQLLQDSALLLLLFWCERVSEVKAGPLPAPPPPPLHLFADFPSLIWIICCFLLIYFSPALSLFSLERETWWVLARIIIFAGWLFLIYLLICFLAFLMEWWWIDLEWTEKNPSHYFPTISINISFHFFRNLLLFTGGWLSWRKWKLMHNPFLKEVWFL